MNSMEHRILKEMENYVAKQTEYQENRNENHYQLQKKRMMEMQNQIRQLHEYTEQEFNRRDNWGKLLLKRSDLLPEGRYG